MAATLNTEVPKVDLSELDSLFSQMDIEGIEYKLGGKAKFDDDIDDIKNIDCSGFVRYILYRATAGALKIPDGSQVQRVWAEKNLREVTYFNAAHYMTESRLFIAFIKPFTNGCGKTGHVWLLQYDERSDKAETMESHGGVGVNSRAWDYKTLRQQVYSCFELPTKL